jgi:thiol-disulfide isomerase/thioredoxin/protocatechuate 3,4-dioxygenase beta subunit
MCTLLKNKLLPAIIAIGFWHLAAVGDASAAHVSGTIGVHVVDKAGNPEANASVDVFEFDEDWKSWKKLARTFSSDGKGHANCDKLPVPQVYVMRVKTHDALIGFRSCTLLENSTQQQIEVIVERPMATWIHVRDKNGKPVPPANVWQLDHSGTNGRTVFTVGSFEVFGLMSQASNAQGELRLPELPPGRLEVRVVRDELAPTSLKEVAVGSKDMIGEMEAGVELTLNLRPGPGDRPIDRVLIDCRHEPFEHPSTLIGPLPVTGGGSRTQVTVAAGSYEQVRLTHPNFAITPYYLERYGRRANDAAEPIKIGPGRDVFTFSVRPKVEVRGRVKNAETGEPVSGASMQGELRAEKDNGPMSHFIDEWSHIGWGETDKNGEYSIGLAAGEARMSFAGDGMVAEPNHLEVTVSADGSTRVPNFFVRPIPKIRGVVLDGHDKPVANAVVRLRGSELIFTPPVLTGRDGRFELSTSSIPEDSRTHERLPKQPLVAFNPFRRMCCEAVVQLDRRDSVSNLVLRMKPEQRDLLSKEFADDLSLWEQGVVPAEEQKQRAAISLAGKPAPELDGGDWLNTDRRTSVKDFRGKYVLLQFWTTWCGPCHSDMPSVRALQELYGDKGFTVVGVHDNSMPIEAIKEDVIKNHLSYPIVVDHRDGRILASYGRHGVSGYPSYLLLGPDGTVVKDDQTIAGPTLRKYKIEIVRKLMLSAGSP